MVKFAYKVNGEVVEKEFKSYPELILFVASNDIKDEDFVSIDMPGLKAEGINGLKQEAITKSTEAIKQQEIMELEDRLYAIEEEVADGAPREDYFDEIDMILTRLEELGVDTEYFIGDDHCCDFAN